mmetsp:Transcript_23230/g.64966  ORF Transcript_23230/g.64966 Transcript_23230/m.64966 type:complete len:125 (+) Transcript_23230:96-470(+)
MLNQIDTSKCGEDRRDKTDKVTPTGDAPVDANCQRQLSSQCILRRWQRPRYDAPGAPDRNSTNCEEITLAVGLWFRSTTRHCDTRLDTFGGTPPQRISGSFPATKLARMQLLPTSYGNAAWFMK